MFIDGTNAGGVPVMLGAGALFGYLAVSGQRLLSLKFGGTEANLGRAADLILRNPSLSDDAKREVAEDLARSNLPLPPSTRREVSRVLTSAEYAAEYAREIRAAVERVAPDVTWPGRDVGIWDGYISDQDEPPLTVPVTVKWSEDRMTTLELLRAMQHSRTSFYERDCLVILNKLPAIRGTEANPLVYVPPSHFSEESRWVIVTWRDPSDDDALRAAITIALDNARSRIDHPPTSR